MDTAIIVELVGYIGSALVLVSFLFTSVVKLRVVNSIGGVIFAIYALIIQSYPTAIMNICLLAINVHFLLKLRRTPANYDLVEVGIMDAFLAYLLAKYQNDIAACFPGISPSLEGVNKAYIVNRNTTPAGILIGHAEDGVMDIRLDYSAPEYRDLSIGKYMISAIPKEGIHTLVYSGPTEHHTNYLNKLGFIQENGRYVKAL
ncbi:MAG: YgjV family protein [Coriobacteriia bacterium]|nr:YgjV family protein [Coriobacteriia bacterium]